MADINEVTNRPCENDRITCRTNENCADKDTMKEFMDCMNGCEEKHPCGGGAGKKTRKKHKKRGGRSSHKSKKYRKNKKSKRSRKSKK